MLTYAPPKPEPKSGAAPAGPAPGGHHARRVLTVRALAAQLDWLVKPMPHWVGDRVAWRLPGGGDLYPTAADLARAQHLLYKTRQYPLASRAVFADPASWRNDRQRAIALVGRLRLLRAPTAAGSAPDMALWIALLPAEALCVFGDVPGPPSRTLVTLAASGRATPGNLSQIAAMVGDLDLPAPVRTMAALVLGAMERHRVRSQGVQVPVTTLSSCARPAFLRGLRNGLPAEAPLIAVLFAQGGAPLAERGERLCVPHARTDDPGLPLPFPLPLALLRETLLQEDPGSFGNAERLMAVAELLQGPGNIVSRRLIAWRHEITPAGRNPKDRNKNAHLRCREEASRLRHSRSEATQEVADRFGQVLRDHAVQTDTAALTAQILRFAEVLLTLSLASTFVLRTLGAALEDCLSLPPVLRAEFFALACEQSAVIWDFTKLAKRVQANPTGVDFGGFLLSTWIRESGRLRTLLRTADDAGLVRDAIHVGVFDAAVQICEDNGDAEHLRLLLRLVRQFRPDTPENRYCPFLNTVQDMLCSFPTGEAARDSLQALENALLAAVRDPARRRFAQRVLAALLNATPTDRAIRHTILTRLAAVSVNFLRWAEAAAQNAWEEYGSAIARVAVLLAREQPKELDSYFGAFVAGVPGEIAVPAREDSYPISGIGVRLAAALAGGDTARFTLLLPIAMAQTQEDDSYLYQDWLKEGIALLERFPGAAIPLSGLFSSQPRRCIALLRQMGRAKYLGSEVLAPLAECDFEPATAAESDDPEWQAILALDPEMAPLVADLWRAQWLLGVRAIVPPGIRRVLQERTRRAAELAYLETLCETKSPGDAPGLFARRDNLRARLQADGVRADTAREIRERLWQAVLEGRMAAAEQQSALGFRERLRQAAGPLPRGFAMTPDLENATILSFTITRNRKPLLKLLRAVVSGEPDPFRNHPENVAFRQQLAAGGADMDAWQDTVPRRVCLPARGSVPSKPLHLFLATDPLAILQMGSYFGTCLSAGSGCNAFSTVPNALEQNKRVLFARDETGRVVARKLIGINADGALVGFHIYCSLSEESGAGFVRAAIRRYLTDFAARCRLPLADSGTIPTLFCEDWYDDGTVPWHDDDEQAGKEATNNTMAECSPLSLGTLTRGCSYR